MTNQLFVVGLVSMAGSGLVYTASESVLPTQGKCWTNGTHFGDEGSFVHSLGPCWVAWCSDEIRSVTIGTPCYAGPDVTYSSSEMAVLMWDRCYPSIRGDLPGDRCCGGHRICADDAKFDVKIYFMELSRWLKRGVHTGWPV